MARLGTVGSLGFLGLLGLRGRGRRRPRPGRAPAARRRRRRSPSWPCSLAQVGGFGSLFSLLVSPDIRAYNRIVVFIAFFSLLAAGLALERLRDGGDRPGPGPTRARPRRRSSLLLLLAVFDQASTTGLRLGHDENARQFDVDRAFVTRLESRLPKGAMVFQLPHTGVPVERDLLAHADLRPRPSLPALALAPLELGGDRRPQRELAGGGPEPLSRAPWCEPWPWPASPGVWIDRLGYDRRAPAPRRPAGAGSAPAPRRRSSAPPARPPETSLDGRYAFVGLEAARRRLVSELGPEGFAREAGKPCGRRSSPGIREGFGEEDGDGARVWRRRAAPAGGSCIMNPLDREREVLLTARLLSPGAGAGARSRSRARSSPTR